ncbi:MAG: response regulator [Candidatus Aminicenantes bacterium]|nr:response regulator [Candidatus Aminicenantes bacterium]
MTDTNSVPIAKHVFIVDPDPSARNGLARLLRIANYNVHEFAAANEFLDALGSEESGCVVLDAGILILSGKELQEEFKAHGLMLPSIIITADDNPKIREKAHQIKASALFRKPVDGTALLDAIDWALNAVHKGKNKIADRK